MAVFPVAVKSALLIFAISAPMVLSGNWPDT
jgi:hypothetical protein